MMTSVNDKIPWSHPSLAAMLQLVKEKRVLWDSNDPMYHKAKLRQETFDAIAENLKLEFPQLSQLNGALVRLKFKNVRTYFLNLYQKMKYLPSSTTWPLFEHSLFMIESGNPASKKKPSNPSHPTPPHSDPDVSTPTITLYGENYVTEADNNSKFQLYSSEDDSQVFHHDVQLSPSGTSNSPHSVNSVFAVSGLTYQHETDSSPRQSPNLGEKGNKKRKNVDDSSDPLMGVECYFTTNSDTYLQTDGLDKNLPGSPPKSKTKSNPKQNHNHRQRQKLKEVDTKKYNGTNRLMKTDSFAVGMGQIVEGAANKLPYSKQIELLGKIYQAIQEVSDTPSSKDNDVATGLII